MLLSLHQSLTIEDGKRLLKAADFGLASLLPLLVCLWLCDAALSNLAIVVHDSRQFRVRCLSVRRKLRNLFVQALEFLGVVLDVLLFHSLGNLVFLGGSLVLGGSIGLLSFFGCQVLGKVTLDNFQNVNDASTCTTSLGMLRWRSRLSHRSTNVGTVL